MMLVPSLAARSSSASAALTALASRASRQALSCSICCGSMAGSTTMIAPSPADKRRGLGLGPLVDADHDLLAALDLAQPLGVALDEAPLHVVDRLHRAAHGLDGGELRPRLLLQLRDLGGDLGRAVEDVAVFQQVGLVGEDLLHAQATIAGPTGAAGRAPRSRPAAARRGRAPSSTASPPASPAGCDRRCSPACCSVSPSEFTCTP